MTGLLNWGVRCFTETETMMNSVERVLYTSQETPQEPPHHISRCSIAHVQQSAVETSVFGALEAWFCWAVL